MKKDRRSIRLCEYDYSQAGAYFVTVCTQNRQCLFGHIVGAAPCGRPQMALNDAGRMIQTAWDEIPHHYSGIGTDALVIMPNHVHGIIVIVGAGPRACPNGGIRGAPNDRPGGGPCHGNIHASDGVHGHILGGSPGHRPIDVPDGGRPRGAAPTDYIGRGVGQTRGIEIGQARGPAPTGDRRDAMLSLPDVVHRFKTLTTKRYTDGVKHDGWPPFPGRLRQRNYHEHIIRNDDEWTRIREYIANNPARWQLDQENPDGARPGHVDAASQQ